jgi:hypothetical protein
MAALLAFAASPSEWPPRVVTGVTRCVRRPEFEIFVWSTGQHASSTSVTPLDHSVSVFQAASVG